MEPSTRDSAMQRFVHWKIAWLGAVLVLLALLGLCGVSTTAAAAREKSLGNARLCQSQNDKPTSRCIAARDVKQGGQNDFTFQIAAKDLRQLRGFGGATRDEVEICIVDHANICPPEPLEIVWVCITTGMLAGQSCPEPPENAPPNTSLTVRLKGR